MGAFREEIHPEQIICPPEKGTPTGERKIRHALVQVPRHNDHLPAVTSQVRHPHFVASANRHGMQLRGRCECETPTPTA